MWLQIVEIAGLILLSSVKFLFAPSTVMAFGYSFWETIIITLSGGWLGVFVFYFAGSAIFDWIAKAFPKKKTPKKFTRSNRFVVWLKNGFGLVGISVVLGFASIPLVSLLAAKYFRHNSKTLIYLISSVTIWGFSLTLASFLIKPYLLQLI
ncbi:MAG: hypothetical protein ACPGEG_04200 [Salibacteraceae bacterium]